MASVKQIFSCSCFSIWILLDVKMEKTQILVSGIEGFDATKLKHTETSEKNPLPDKDGELYV